jgi:hypothetical protein
MPCGNLHAYAGFAQFGCLLEDPNIESLSSNVSARASPPIPAPAMRITSFSDITLSGSELNVQLGSGGQMPPTDQR